jgi:hypothetical protein
MPGPMHGVEMTIFWARDAEMALSPWSHISQHLAYVVWTVTHYPLSAKPLLSTPELLELGRPCSPLFTCWLHLGSPEAGLTLESC